MEGTNQGGAQDSQQQPPVRVVERLNPAVQQQLNLESVKTCAISLFKAISRILEELDAIACNNGVPKWQDTLGQFSMVNLELYNIVEDIKIVSKAFVVYPKNVNAENATVLPVMASSKLLPEMEIDDNIKSEQLLSGMQHLPVAQQIEKLKARIDMIGAACESAEKIIDDARKAHFGSRQGPTLLPTIDKVQAAKIQEQENLLRGTVNHGEGLRLPGDQKQFPSSLPAHMVDVLPVNENTQSFSDSSGMYQKNTPPLMSTPSNNNQSTLFQTGAQLIGRTTASPSTGATSFDNTTTSPMQYANSPRSSANIMNTPSPQQQSYVHTQQNQIQQRQKMMQPHQQLLAQQQLRQPSMMAMGQGQQSQLHDMHNLPQQKFQSIHGQHHVQFPPSLTAQHLQGRQLTSAGMHIASNQLNQGNQLNRQLNQFSSPANSALFNAAQTTPTSQMITNMSAMMPSQSIPRMQFGMSGGNRSIPSQSLSDQMFNMGAANVGGMMPIQQQQGTFGNMPQNLQSGMQNTAQNHHNFQQQRQQNQK